MPLSLKTGLPGAIQYLCDNSNAYSSHAEVCQCQAGAQVGVGSTGDLQVEILLLTNPELERGFMSSLCSAAGCNSDGSIDLGMDLQQCSEPVAAWHPRPPTLGMSHSANLMACLDWSSHLHSWAGLDAHVRLQLIATQMVSRMVSPFLKTKHFAQRKYE